MLLCEVDFGPEQHDVLATLGDPRASTCSIEFAKTWLAPAGGRIDGYDSFEAAAEAVADEAADYLLIPGAYPRIAQIIQDESFFCCDTFRARLPNIVLAAGHDAAHDVAPARLYYHPALELDAQGLRAKWGSDFEAITVSSNPVACEKTLEDPESYALTNGLAAKAYGVKVLTLLGAGRIMPCAVFQKSTSDPIEKPLRPWLGVAAR